MILQRFITLLFYLLLLFADRLFLLHDPIVDSDLGIL
jgi:hypothetical protein